MYVCTGPYKLCGFLTFPFVLIFLCCTLPPIKKSVLTVEIFLTLRTHLFCNPDSWQKRCNSGGNHCTILYVSQDLNPVKINGISS
ncbi:hypothetical protein FKM82_018444 [Ascaphus truei]